MIRSTQLLSSSSQHSINPTLSIVLAPP